MSEFFMQATYIVSGFAHLHRMRVAIEPASLPAIGDDVNTINLSTKSGGTKSFQEAMSGYTQVLASLYNADYSLISCELWRYPFGTSANGVWYATADPADATNPLTLTGAGTGQTNLAGTEIMTLRTGTGAVARAVLNETANSGTSQLARPDFSAEQEFWAVQLVGSDSVFVAKDGTRFVQTMRLSMSENEKLFRKRFR
jgi:hypothetical protein